MKSKVLCTAIVSLLMICNGCASYTTKQVQLNSVAANATSAKGDLCLYVDEYASETKCKQAFDTDLTKEGVLAILAKVENNGDETYDVTARDFVIKGGPVLVRMTPEEAAGKAKRSAVGRAIGWSMIVPIISIPIAATASAMHTNGVNKKIVEDFEAKGFKDGSILPHKDRSGFLFFKLPEGQKDLNGLELVVDAKNKGSQDTASIAAALPKASFNAPKEESKEQPKSPSEDR